MVRLRALESSDLDFLYKLENDQSVWEISNTSTPYSKYVLKQYLENAHRDIFEVKQLRLVIVQIDKDRPVGFVGHTENLIRYYPVQRNSVERFLR